MQNPIKNLKTKSKRLVATTALALMAATPVAQACTGLALTAKDGGYVSGRTVEFGIDLGLNGLFVPRGYAFTGTLPDGKQGMSYTSKYAYLGTNAFGEAAVVDGLNEKGLAVGMFYFPGFAKYPDPTPQNQNIALSPTEFPNWILSQFATVDEVKAQMNNVAIMPTQPKGWPVIPPVHYVVYDAQGKSIVIEPIDGKLSVSDNPLGVITNSPPFDWHMTNLSNYVNLTPLGTSPKKVDGVEIQAYSTGSGLGGLPGDFTAPSRFVRAAIFSASSVTPTDSEDAAKKVLHLLNQFDIPLGAVRTAEPGGKTQIEWTLATVARDPKNFTYYFRTYDNQNLRKIRMDQFDFNGKQIMQIDYAGGQPIEDVSNTAKPMK
ncbi:MAG: choloylglycine hydrolase family protein [Burkholderiaceae bacterium]|nr:choloylglycine hydrolase family protein [Burkholderiaceae bacterium]MCD8516483.1 choloylglycine hydrolase family protein [Burkholderiaceae bacterium]MCD8537182.1 choloylglycine hydrolase family protein [Burkholderiaceae bacterium]